ncbi:glucosyltransferase [Calothrix sp. NIES-2100]|uniref:PssD/Cps14F family polysaccharide biosynthesis glycosyltransferase n=1 Tax=Calothrix sp. NIES-2100 TaxID=1954172 RepID=UPI000B60688B|nr:glucosyltransferase [Calothrix sp. NIES-2100]
MKVLLVCSSGGHFKGIEQLRPFWEQHERVWVTFKTATTQAALAQETVYWAFSPTNRNLPNLFKNLLLAFQVISQTQPDLIISTGAGVAVPFLMIGKLFGSKTAFIESVTRIQTLSLSAKLLLPFLSVLYVQWPQLQARYPQAELIIPQESV